MRLGDLDALKEEIENIEVGRFFRKSVLQIIDNAPTVNKCDNCDLMFLEKTRGDKNGRQ
jgi:hypothetical protein